MKFNKTFDYDNRMDKEVVDLCNAMNSLPGIETTSSCCGHGATSFEIYFKVLDSKEGLFFLGRCISNRYWKYGDYWSIEVSVGDLKIGDFLPIMYILSSGVIRGDLAYKQAKSLIDNMNLHLNHKAFMKGFKLSIKVA